MAQRKLITKSAAQDSAAGSTNGAPARKRGPITRTPGVCGGDACIAGTRIPVWVLYRAKQLGASEAQLLEMYPSLNRDQLRSAWEYAEKHEADIQRLIKKNEAW